jgi:hypothetical protein
MSAAAAPMSSAGRPKKRKRPFPAPLAPLPSDEKEEQDQNRQQEGEHETGKEGPGILTSKLFSELPISDLTARAIAEMDHTRLTHVRPLHGCTRSKFFTKPYLLRELLPVLARFHDYCTCACQPVSVMLLIGW